MSERTGPKGFKRRQYAYFERKAVEASPNKSLLTNKAPNMQPMRKIRRQLLSAEFDALMAEASRDRCLEKARLFEDDEGKTSLRRAYDWCAKADAYQASANQIRGKSSALKKELERLLRLFFPPREARFLKSLLVDDAPFWKAAREAGLNRDEAIEAWNGWLACFA